MTRLNPLPRILIIDDLFGRVLPDRRNEERANLSGQYLIEDVTGDEVGKGPPQKVKAPVAQAVFYRGQRPLCAKVGDVVENDLDGTLRIIREGWKKCKPDGHRWAMVLLDLCFYTGLVSEESNRRTPGMPEGRDGDDDPQQYFGLRILERMQCEVPDLPVIIISSKPREEVSREFSYRGALAFLPREDEHSPNQLQEFIRRYGLIPDGRGEIIGRSKSLLFVLRAARVAASRRQNVLIRGERGTGKDLLARYINLEGASQNKTKLVVVNSSVLTPELFSSELFGIEPGTATGVAGRRGLILEADGGDLFLDEIKDMLPQVQAGILRVMEERKIIPVGGKKSIPVNVRFLSATNVDIEALAATGSFREDLLDRLRKGGTIYIPPLRERKEDIPWLVEKFVRDAEKEYPEALRRTVEPEALERLCAYDWPGNIRELHACIFNAVSNYPDVEHLFAIHLPIPDAKFMSANSVSSVRTSNNKFGQQESGIRDIDELIEKLNTFQFDSRTPAKLMGQLQRIQNAYATLIAQYLSAALEATSKQSLEHPEGKILIHPAMKLITGESVLTAVKAADLIKKLLSISPEIMKSLLTDPLLKEAYETALRLRPKQQGRNSNIRNT